MIGGGASIKPSHQEPKSNGTGVRNPIIFSGNQKQPIEMFRDKISVFGTKNVQDFKAIVEIFSGFNEVEKVANLKLIQKSSNLNLAKAFEMISLCQMEVYLGGIPDDTNKERLVTQLIQDIDFTKKQKMHKTDQNMLTHFFEEIRLQHVMKGEKEINEYPTLKPEFQDIVYNELERQVLANTNLKGQLTTDTPGLENAITAVEGSYTNLSKFKLLLF